MICAAPHDVVQEAATFGVALEGRLGEQIAQYLELLLETNKSFNLTAVTEPEAAWRKHILDSLSLAPHLKRRPDLLNIIDVGSGGGLPALPLAIALPERSFTLLESTGKKARFLTEASGNLGLTNISVIEARAESYGQGEGRARFDAATARAVSRLPVLLELTLPLLRIDGLCLALKGEQAELEVDEAQRALQVLGAVVTGLTRTSTGTIIAIDKRSPTPAKYPRRPGEPKRSPL